MTVSAESVVKAFVEGINTHGVDILMELMSAEHVFIDSLGTTVRGKETMCKGWEGYFKMVPDYTLAIEETHSSGNVVIMFGMAHGTYVKDGHLLPENFWETPVALRALVEDGKVKEWRVYADNEPLRQLMSKNRANP